MEHSPETRLQLKEAVEALEDRRLDECHTILDGLSPQLPSVIALRGLACAQAGALERGIEVLEAGLTVNPKNRQIKLHLAALLEQIGAPEEALEVLEGGPLDGQGFSTLYARCLLQVGRPERAEAACKLALAQHPQDLDLLEIYVRLLLHREAFDEALATLGRVSWAGVSPLERLYAEASLGGGRGGEALLMYRALHRQAPEDPEILGGLAAALKATGAPLEAYGYVLRATINAPHQAWLHRLHARLGVQLGRLDAAMGAAVSGVTLEPESPQALRLALSVARARGRYAEAEPFAQRLLLIDPQAPEARAALALIACLEGVLERATRLIGPADALEDPDLLIAHACARLLAGAPGEAIKALKRAARQRLDDPLVQDLLGVAYQPEGDPRFGIRSALQTARGDEQRVDLMGFIEEPRSGGRLSIPQPAGPTLSAALNGLLGEEAPRGDAPTFSMPPEEQGAEESIRTFDLGWADETEPPLEMGLLDDEITGISSPTDALKRLLREPLFADLLGRIEHAKARLDEPLLLAVVGPDGAGKSSLINALIGQPVIPLQTRWPHLLKYGRQPSGRFILQSGESIKRPLTDLQQLPEETPVRLVEILLPLEELTHASFLDLPIAVEDEALLDEADGFIWVVAADQSAQHWDAMPRRSQGKPSIAICNTKGMPHEQLKAVEGQIRGRLSEGTPLIAVDARAGLEAVASRDTKAFRASGLLRLRRGLERIFFSKAERLRDATLQRSLNLIRARAVARVETRQAEIEARIDALAALSISLQTAQITSSEIWAGLLSAMESLRSAEEGEIMAALISMRVVSRAKLEFIAKQSIEALQIIFPPEGASAESARVLGLAALLESHKEMLLEQSFGRGEAYLRGFHAQRPTSNPDLSHFLPRAAPLEAVIQRFVEEAITEQRLALLKLEKKYEEPLRQEL